MHFDNTVWVLSKIHVTLVICHSKVKWIAIIVIAHYSNASVKFILSYLSTFIKYLPYCPFLYLYMCEKQLTFIIINYLQTFLSS